jgi:DNA-binding transcriptional LysR family regulator
MRLCDTKEEKYIAVSRDFSMRKFFEDSCRMAGFVPEIAIECDYLLRSSMLSAKYGIVFTTESGARAQMLQDAVYIPVADPPIRRTQGIFYRKNLHLSKTMLQFRDFMVNYYQSWGSSNLS